MQFGTVDFVSTVLPLTTHSYSPISTEQNQSNSTSYYKTNTTVSSSSSSGYESVLSHSSKSHRSLFSRLKHLINFPSAKKSSSYRTSTLNNSSEQYSNYSISPKIFKNLNSSSRINTNAMNSDENRRKSVTRLDIRRKSARGTSSSANQHIPFLYGLKNCGNTW